MKRRSFLGMCGVVLAPFGAVSVAKSRRKRTALDLFNGDRVKWKARIRALANEVVPEGFIYFVEVIGKQHPAMVVDFFWDMQGIGTGCMFQGLEPYHDLDEFDADVRARMLDAVAKEDRKRHGRRLL